MWLHANPQKILSDRQRLPLHVREMQEDVEAGDFMDKKTTGIVGGIVGAGLGALAVNFLKSTSTIFVTNHIDPGGSTGGVWLVKRGVKYLFSSPVWDPFAALYPGTLQMVTDGTLIVDPNIGGEYTSGPTITSWRMFYQLLAQ